MIGGVEASYRGEEYGHRYQQSQKHDRGLGSNETHLVPPLSTQGK
jgi:hypothetical protein